MTTLLVKVQLLLLALAICCATALEFTGKKNLDSDPCGYLKCSQKVEDHQYKEMKSITKLTISYKVDWSQPWVEVFSVSKDQPTAPVGSKNVVANWDDQSASIELNIAKVNNDDQKLCSEGIYRCMVDYIDIYDGDDFLEERVYMAVLDKEPVPISG
ncbi:hypothetical protein RRG08_042762 [Elysia crispata]|uniref:Uncharacterized protein n=1 Tax=Elysia crispata TaxID=231223 RepID=A0AAE0XQN1_9GAST|nr:hypothetical protein RRG08_042762 [Elysia crispata]